MCFSLAMSYCNINSTSSNTISRVLVVPDAGEIICNKLTVSQLHFISTNSYFYRYHTGQCTIGSMRFQLGY